MLCVRDNSTGKLQRIDGTHYGILAIGF